VQRWPGIVAAIRTLVAAYNEGAGVQLLTATESSQGEPPTVTIVSAASTSGAISVSLDGDAFLVQPHQPSSRAVGLHETARRIDGSRTDMGTAAYLVQAWMDRL
jgi:hypothetical protein